MNAEDVKFAWLIYLSVGIIAVLLWVLLIYKFKSAWLKVMLTLMAVAFLFTPVKHPVENGLWVPGSVASVMHWMSHGLEAAMPILITMGASQMAAILVGVLVLMLRRSWLASRQARAS